MTVLLLPHAASRDEVTGLLVQVGIEVIDYFDVWHSQDDTHDAKRLRIAEIVAQVEAVVLDLTSADHHPSAALTLGMAVISKKRTVMIADTSADHVGDARHVLRYSPGDADAMALFADALLEAVESPYEVKASEPARTEVFLSYSHADAEYLNRLRVHLRPLERNASIRAWSDRDIRSGSLWADEVEKALDRASIAVLLVSADFLASDFIVNNELPPLLKKARSKGCTILALILTDCRFARDPQLSIYQAVNDPAQPLANLPLSERERFYDQVAAEIEALTYGSDSHFP